MRQYSRIGRRLPAYSTSLGKALLASQTGRHRDMHIPAELSALTVNTITDRRRLDEDLEVTRGRGFAIDAEENTLGLECFAVALPYSEPVQDAISVSIPKDRLTNQKEDQVIAALRQASEKICGIIGPISGAVWM